MQRVRSYALKAHPKLEHKQRERIIVNSFLLGLHDRQLAASLAAVKPERASDSMKMASEIEAVRKDNRSKRSVTSVLP